MKILEFYIVYMCSQMKFKSSSFLVMEQFTVEQRVFVGKTYFETPDKRYPGLKGSSKFLKGRVSPNFTP